VYDLHCHLLPGIDDGAETDETALEMARMAVADGITHLACTPHIYPGLFENDTNSIRDALTRFRGLLEEQQICLTLGMGADIQVVPELLSRLRSGTFPCLNASRYFLFEPPHHVPLMNFVRFIADVLSAGFVPVITHPERLVWLEQYYEEFLTVARAGAWLQLTAGSLTGRFGSGPRYWAEKMLDAGVVHLLATDAHDLHNRPPLLAEGEVAACRFLGVEEARRLVHERPAAIWRNKDPDQLPLPPGLLSQGSSRTGKSRGIFRFFPGRRN